MQIQAAREALQASVDIESASFLPDLFIAGYVGGSYSPAHDLIENSLLNRGLTYYEYGLSLGLRMTLDIPQKLARLREARATLKKIDSQARRAEAGVEFEIEKRLKDIQSATDNLKALKKGRRAAKAWMRANFMSYGVGIADTKDLLDSLAAYAKAQIEFNRGQHDTLVLVDQLKSAVGVDLGRAP
jgi:outer membrane protein TolC